MQFALATVAHAGRVLGCIEINGRFYPIDSAGEASLPADLTDLFADWHRHWPALVRVAARRAPPAGLASGEVTVLTPLQYPGKVLCAGANYYDHIAEMGVPDVRKESQRLFFFFKPPRNALVGPGPTEQYPRAWDFQSALSSNPTTRSGRRSRRSAFSRSKLPNRHN